MEGRALGGFPQVPLRHIVTSLFLTHTRTPFLGVRELPSTSWSTEGSSNGGNEWIGSDCLEWKLSPLSSIYAPLLQTSLPSPFNRTPVSPDAFSPHQSHFKCGSGPPGGKRPASLWRGHFGVLERGRVAEVIFGGESRSCVADGLLGHVTLWFWNVGWEEREGRDVENLCRSGLQVSAVVRLNKCFTRGNRKGEIGWRVLRNSRRSCVSGHVYRCLFSHSDTEQVIWNEDGLFMVPPQSLSMAQWEQTSPYIWTIALIYFGFLLS